MRGGGAWIGRSWLGAEEAKSSEDTRVIE